MYYERILEQTIAKTSRTFPVVLVTAPHQVGKTTLLTKMAAPDRTVVSLDNPTIRGWRRRIQDFFCRDISRLC